MIGGEIVWGVKDTFIRYVRGAGGTIEFLGGAWSDGGDRFHFPLAPGADDGRDAVTSVGTVRINAHGGLLSLLIADPRLDRRNGHTVLSTRLEQTTDEWTPIAELRPSSYEAWDRELRWSNVETRLTEDGADAIDPLHYFAGQRVDGVDLIISTPAAQPSNA